MQHLSYRDPAALSIGLGQLRKQGLTPRGLLALALDPRGEVHVAVPKDLDEVARIRVGDKLSLQVPWEGRFFHFDSIYRLPVGLLWNGDRRLAQPGSNLETAYAVCEWLKTYGARNVFLGCTPHQPATWWARDERTPAVALHESGYVDVTTTPRSLLARRIGYPHLYHLPLGLLGGGGRPLLDGWAPVFESPLGNILLLERRVLTDRLVLTCERGLVEVDLSELPQVRATVQLPLQSGVGVVGRVDGGAYAFTTGRVEPWGLADVAPATLVGAEGDTLQAIAATLPETLLKIV